MSVRRVSGGGELPVAAFHQLPWDGEAQSHIDFEAQSGSVVFGLHSLGCRLLSSQSVIRMAAFQDGT